jgi:sec-independent protein translocase protein TatC
MIKVSGVRCQVSDAHICHLTPDTQHPTPDSAVHRQHNEDLFESTKMTFGEHLEELRRSLFKAVAALVVGFCLALTFANHVVDYVQTPVRRALKEHYGRMEVEKYQRFLEQRQAEGLPVPADPEAAVKLFAEQGLVAEERYVDPQQLLAALEDSAPGGVELPEEQPPDVAAPPRRDELVPLRIYHDLDRDSRLQLVGLGAQEPFVVYMKAAFVVGAVIASPFVFYFIWQFVAAGLYPHERRYIHVFLPFSLGLFLSGAALAFFVVFRYVLRFLLWFYELTSIDPDLRISDWLSFVLILPLGFGIAFQLPLVMLFLERIGIFTVASYLSFWRVSVLVICFLSMILTPSDPQSMILMAVPLVFLYFGGVLLCKLMPRRTTPFGEVID